MADEATTDDATINGFFLRSGLTLACRDECFHFVDQAYPGSVAFVPSCQGYCSLTIFVGDDMVVQFRPYNYRLDLKLTSVAREVYGEFAPNTHYVTSLPHSRLLVYNMERIGGISFKNFRMRNSRAALYTERRATLCRGFAGFLARSWKETSSQALPLGMVGETIGPRVQALVSSLPSRFRSIARRVQQGLHRIEALPWVLTHGDVAEGNIMLDPLSGRLTGLVDWAEAERLPFGICSYGLEELLGEMTSTGFVYHHNASILRSIFWDELEVCIPELKQPDTLEAVRLARDLGILLWHGIAFDNGAIDRVVQEGRDVEEIHRLDAFFNLENDAPVTEFPKL